MLAPLYFVPKRSVLFEKGIDQYVERISFVFRQKTKTINHIRFLCVQIIRISWLDFISKIGMPNEIVNRSSKIIRQHA